MEKDTNIDAWGLLNQLASTCPDVAVAILNRKIEDTMSRQLNSISVGILDRQFFKDIVAAGGVIAGSFVLGGLYWPSDPIWHEKKFGDIDIWVDASQTVRGDPRQLLPEDHPVRQLDWFEDAAEISRFYGCFPLPFPYIAREDSEEKKLFNESRFFHPIILVLAKYWWKRSTLFNVNKLNDGKDLSHLRTLDDLLHNLPKAFTVQFNKLGLALWGETHGPEPYTADNYEFDDYEESITHRFGKADKGILSTRTFDYLNVQLHIVDTNGRGVRKWIEEVFDFNLCGAVQYDKFGLYVREPISRTLQVLRTKTMSYSTRCRLLDWTPARKDLVLKALEQDNALETAGDPFLGTRLGSVNVIKVNEEPEMYFPVLFEWAKVVLLPPVRTLEDLYERMSTIKLNRIVKYHRRGFSIYFPGIYHTSEQIKDHVRDLKETSLMEKCQSVFQAFQGHVEAHILTRFIHLVATDPVKPHNGYGTGPTYYF